ncbi:DUF1427 family protein [Streptomyces kronopolitis]
MAYLEALAAGAGVGVMYGLVRFPSPAPPLLGLVGLAGMLIGYGVLRAVA